MHFERKIALLGISALIMILAASLGIGAYLQKQKAPQIPENPVLTPPDSNQTFNFKTFDLQNGFAINIVDSWELVAQDLNRQVDRFRFEKMNNGNSVLAVSFYERNNVTSFEELIQLRYGEGFIETVEEFTISDMPARRVSTGFTNGNGLDRNASDVLVQIGQDKYLALNALHEADGEQGAITAEEINFMQTSLRPTD